MVKKDNPQGFERYLLLLELLASHQKLSTRELYEKTGIPEVSIKRILERMREDLMMDILFVRAMGQRGNSGYYKIKDWGLLSKDKFQKLYIEPKRNKEKSIEIK